MTCRGMTCLVSGQANRKLVTLNDGAQGSAQGALQAPVENGHAVRQLAVALLDPAVVLEQLPGGEGLGGLELRAQTVHRK